MRISDWSSYVCSSDLAFGYAGGARRVQDHCIIVGRHLNIELVRRRGAKVRFPVLHQQDGAKVRQRRTFRLDDRDEVGSPMFLVKNQADRPALARQRTDLAPAQSRVERDDDQARLGRSKLKQGPWSAIRAPDGNILSGTEMLGEEGC